MTMIETDTLILCECCALLIANGDESGCRDYHGHTHQSANVPAHTVLTGESDQPCYPFTRDGCGERQDATPIGSGPSCWRPSTPTPTTTTVPTGGASTATPLPTSVNSSRGETGHSACRRGMTAHDLKSQVTTEGNTP